MQLPGAAQGGELHDYRRPRRGQDNHHPRPDSQYRPAECGNAHPVHQRRDERDAEAVLHQILDGFLVIQAGGHVHVLQILA